MASHEKMYGRLSRRVSGGWMAAMKSGRTAQEEVFLADEGMCTTRNASPFRVRVSKRTTTGSAHLKVGTPVAAIVRGDLTMSVPALERRSYGYGYGSRWDDNYSSSPHSQDKPVDQAFALRWGVGQRAASAA